MPAADSGTDTELRYGYTLSEINKLATVAVWRDVWHQSLPLSERQDIAWSAIAEHLYARRSLTSPLAFASRRVSPRARVRWRRTVRSRRHR